MSNENNNSDSNSHKCPASFNHKHPTANILQERYFDFIKILLIYCVPYLQ